MSIPCIVVYCIGILYLYQYTHGFPYLHSIYSSFPGKHCERCDHKLTCKGGVCKKIGDTYKCQCEPGYNMTRCVNGEMCTYKCVSACKESDYCTQYDTDATCKLDNAVPMCKCSPRYYGSHCIQDKCFLDENVCQNGGKDYDQFVCVLVKDLII